MGNEEKETVTIGNKTIRTLTKQYLQNNCNEQQNNYNQRNTRKTQRSSFLEFCSQLLCFIIGRLVPCSLSFLLYAVSGLPRDHPIQHNTSKENNTTEQLDYYGGRKTMETRQSE